MSSLSESRKRHHGKKRMVIPLFVGSCVAVILFLYLRQFASCASFLLADNNNINEAINGPVVKQHFRGLQYWKEGVTQNVRTLYETAFARFQIHTVLLEDGKTIVDDWMFYDEADHINVLVEQEPADGETASSSLPPSYIVFRQTKYAIQGETLAILGGLVEPGEDPRQAAKRELQEELDMISPEWESLGSYRVAVNRGGGTMHAFLARKARLISTAPGKQTAPFAIGESEKQKTVILSREELLEALLAGKFQEVKWTATIALAILKTQQIYSQ